MDSGPREERHARSPSESRCAGAPSRDLRPEREAFAHLMSVVRKLRAPGGCPWDRAQTHHSMKCYLLEETYEVLEAIDRGSGHKMCEELGDLLLQIALHAVVAEECGEFDMAEVLFDMAEVLNSISRKMIRRHPHVFAEAEMTDVDVVLSRWENIKAEERFEARPGEEPDTTALSGVPAALPALLQAEKVQAVASRLGFDWSHIDGVRDKVLEEVEEFAGACRQGDNAAMESELGDLLFSPEMALLGAVHRFRRRFCQMERETAQDGKSLQDMSLEEMDIMWERAKKGP